MRLPEHLRRLAYRLAGREPTIEDERLLALLQEFGVDALMGERYPLAAGLKLSPPSAHQ
jgi:hypothetical protein